MERRILILDDDVLNSKALAKRLERRDMKVTVLNDANSLFETIEKENIEMVLLDIIMPDVNGIAVLKNIREKYDRNELPVIMVTAMDDSIDVMEAFQFGANDYITKPVHVDVAVARIAAHLSIVDLHREGVQRRELEAINAMITTYHHEINNPLAIAMACLESDLAKEPETIKKLKSSLWRVADIVSKIKDVSENKKIEYQKYTGHTKMVKLKS